MTRHRDYLKKPGATLWSCATLLTLGVYAGLTAWLLYNPTTTEAQAAPAAMMIELAPTPEAQVVKENLDVAPDTVIRQQSSAPSAKPLEKLPKKTEPEKKEATGQTACASGRTGPGGAQGAKGYVGSRRQHTRQG